MATWCNVNRYSKHPKEAEKFIKFLISHESLKTISLTTGYKPARKSLYNDEDLINKQPFINLFYKVFMKAKPRPVTPYYMMIIQILQTEFSAALSGIKTPEEALRSAHRQIEHILKVEGS